MFVKLMKAGRPVDLYHCRHVTMGNVPESSPKDEPGGDFDPDMPLGGRKTVGLRFELRPFPDKDNPKPKPVTIVIPRDGDTVYVTNDKGDTADTYRWPLAKED